MCAYASHLLNFLKPLFLFIEHILSVHCDAVLIFLLKHHRVWLADKFFFEARIRFGDHHQLSDRVNFFVGYHRLSGLFFLGGDGGLDFLNDWWLVGWAALVYVLDLADLGWLLHGLLLFDNSIELETAVHPWPVFLTLKHHFSDFLAAFAPFIPFQDFQNFFL